MITTQGLRLNTYAIVARAVEEGVERGVRRAFKYADHPSEPSLVAQCEQEVLNALCEVLLFEDDEPVLVQQPYRGVTQVTTFEPCGVCSCPEEGQYVRLGGSTCPHGEKMQQPRCGGACQGGSDATA